MKGKQKGKGNCRSGSALIDHLSVPHAKIMRKGKREGEKRKGREKGRERG